MIWFFGTKQEQLIARNIEAAVNRAIGEAVGSSNVAFRSVAEIQKLKEEITTLKIEKAKQVEDHERTKREIEHKVGLHKEKVEQEIAHAKRETAVSLREQNLQKDEQRFSAQMKFEREHLQAQIESTNKLVAQLLERLPSAEIIANIGGK